jgi:hypothetical protein
MESKSVNNGTVRVALANSSSAWQLTGTFGKKQKSNSTFAKGRVKG